MYGRTGDLYSLFKRSAMYPESVEPGTAEGWNKRRMNVDDPVIVTLREIGREYLHKAGKNDKIDRVLFKQLCNAVFNAFFAVFSDRYRLGRYAGGNGSSERICVTFVGNHKHNSAAVQDTAFFGVNKCLKICASARNQYGNPCISLSGGVFAFHKAQCEGIAKAMKVLLNAVDVKCIVVTGDSIKSGQCVPHAWNIVDIDGEPYQLDVTWDIGTVKSRKILYDYFNLPDSLMNLEHRPENTLPKCNKSSANYFVKAKCDFHTHYGLLRYIQKQVEQEKKEIVFRVNGMLKKENVIDMVEGILRQKDQNTETTQVNFSYSFNEKIGIYYIRIN